MSFAASKARITKGIKSGKYQKPDTTIQDGFMAASNIVAEGLLRQGERRREEEKRKLEEARELAKDQKAKEQDAVKRKRKAEALAKDLGFSEGNTGAVTYLTEQLFLYDDDSTFVQKKADSDMKLKRLKEKELPPIVEDVTSARIGKAPPLRLDDGVGGEAGTKTIVDNGRERPLTTLDLQELADGRTARIDSKTGEKIAQPELMSEAQQMMGAFGPQQLEKSEVTQAETKQFGLEIDPDAKEPVELDYQRLTTLDDIDLYVGEIKSKGQTLTDDQQTVIDNRKNLLNGRRVDAAIADAVKDENNAKSALMALEAKVNQAATEDEKNKITDSYEYKAIKGFVDRFALGENYEVPINQLKTAQDVQLEKAFIVMNKKNVGPEVMAALEEMEKGYIAKEAEDKRLENEPSLAEKISIINLDDDEIAELAKITANSQDPRTQRLYEYATLLKEAASGKEINVSEYLGNMGSVNATKNRIIEIKNDTDLTDDEKEQILAVMEPHLVELQQSAKKLKLTDIDYLGDVVIDNEKGIVVKQELVLTEDGEFFSPMLQKTFSSDEVQNAISVKSQETLMSNATRLQDNAFAKMGDVRKNMSDLLRRAKSIDDIVQTTDGEILTFVGGTFPSIMKRIENEVGSLNTLLGGSSTGTINSVVENAINEEIKAQSQQLDKIGINAQEYAKFQSRLIEFAFTYARTGLGQVRTTDQDFNAAVKVVSAGSDYPTFSINLRGLVKSAYAMNQQEHDDYLIRPDVVAAQNTVGADAIYGDFLITMSDYLQNQEDIPEAITWMNTEVPQAPAPQKNQNQVLNEYLNSDVYKNDTQKINEFETQEDKEMFINMIARRLQINSSIVRSQLLKNEE
jgi:hypothetical protein